VFGMNDLELKVLGEFIEYKNRCVERIQTLEVNLLTIMKGQWQVKNLKEFFSKDINEDARL